MSDPQATFQFEQKEKFHKTTKFWVVVFCTLVAALLIMFFWKNVIQESLSAEEIGRSIQVVWHDSRWLDKPGMPGEAVIIPSFTFKIKNVGSRPLQYIQFSGVFQYEESGETLSDGFTQAVQKTLAPGQASEDIFIKSFWGYKASSKEAFIKNIKEWKRINVKLFARSKGSKYALLGVFPISQKIAGVNVITPMEESVPPPSGKQK